MLQPSASEPSISLAMPQLSAVDHSGTMQIDDIPRVPRQQEQSLPRQIRIAYIYNDVAEDFLDDAETDSNESQKLLKALSEASRITKVSTEV
jgi:hypothetical protein